MTTSSECCNKEADTENSQFAFLSLRRSHQNPTTRQSPTDCLNDNLKRSLSSGLNSIFREKPSLLKRIVSHWMAILFVVFLLLILVLQLFFPFRRVEENLKLLDESDVKVNAESEMEMILQETIAARKELETLKKARKEAVDMEKGQKWSGKSEYHENTDKSRIWSGVDVKTFSEEKMYAFIDEVRDVLSKDRNFMEFMGDEEFKESLGASFKRSSTVDPSISLKRFDQYVKMSENLRKTMQTLKKFESNLQQEAKLLITAKKQQLSFRNDLKQKKEFLRKDAEKVSKFKEERKLKIEDISNLKIQLENLRRNQRKSKELNDEIELEREIALKGLEKRQTSLTEQIQLVQRLFSDTRDLEIENEEILAKRVQNSKRKLVLLEKHNEVIEKLNETQIKLEEELNIMALLEFTLAEIESILKTMRRFYELHSNIKKELSNYDKDVDKDRKKSHENEFKEKENVIRKIRDFQKRTFETLEEVFSGQEFSSDAFSEEVLLSKIAQKKTEIENAAQKVLSYEKQKQEFSDYMNNIKKELMTLSKEKSTEENEKKIKSKNERIADSEELQERFKLEIIDLEEKIKDLESKFGDLRAILNKIKNEVELVNGNLSNEEKALSEKEAEILYFTRIKVNHIKAVKDLIKKVKINDEKIASQHKKVKGLQDQLELVSKDVENLNEQFSKIFCGYDPEVRQQN